MRCDMCRKNDAIVYVEQTSRLGIKKVNLCRSCAVSLGINPESREIDRQVGSIFKQIQQDRRDQALKDDSACPVCGRLRSEIIRGGKLGCPECYAIFKGDVLDYFAARNIKARYTGTMPRRLANFRSVLTDRVQIREKMDAAIKNEDYEKAAFYRDYLHAIEKKSVSPAEGEDGGGR